MSYLSREYLSIRKIPFKHKVVHSFIITALTAVFAVKIYMMFIYIDPLVGLYSVFVSFLVASTFIVSYLMYKDPAAEQNSKTRKDKNQEIPKVGILDRMPLVSVIIPVKNDPVMVLEAVKSCLRSTYDNLEVIVVNDGSTDKTGIVLDKMQTENLDKMRVIHLEKNRGKRKAVREGILKAPARGEIIVLMDSDTIFEKTAIERMVGVFDDPDVGGVSGHCRAYNANQNLLTKMQDPWYDGSFSIAKASEGIFGAVTCVPGVIAAYRKEAILPALDRWSNDIFLGTEFSMGDDRHLTSYVLGGNKHYIDDNHRAWKVVYSESATALTEVPSTLRKFVLQQIRWKKSWVRVFLFTAPFFYKGRHPYAVVTYYPKMVLPLISPFIAFRSLVVLPTQGDHVSAMVYVAGIFFISLMFAAEFKLRNPSSGYKWAYRLLWGMISPVFSVLQIYAILTIKDRAWKTR